MEPEPKLRLLPKVTNPAGLSITFMAGWVLCSKTYLASSDASAAVLIVSSLVIFFLATFLATLESRYSKQVWEKERIRLGLEAEILGKEIERILRDPRACFLKTNAIGLKKSLAHVRQVQILIQLLPNQTLKPCFTPIQYGIVTELTALKKAVTKITRYPTNELVEYANKILGMIGYSDSAPQEK